MIRPPSWTFLKLIDCGPHDFTSEVALVHFTSLCISRLTIKSSFSTTRLEAINYTTCRKYMFLFSRCFPVFLTYHLFTSISRQCTLNIELLIYLGKYQAIIAKFTVGVQHFVSLIKINTDINKLGQSIQGSRICMWSWTVTRFKMAAAQGLRARASKNERQLWTYKKIASYSWHWPFIPRVRPCKRKSSCIVEALLKASVAQTLPQFKRTDNVGWKPLLSSKKDKWTGISFKICLLG